MTKYLEEMINEFPEEIDKKAVTPAADHLFKVRPPSEQKLLSEEQARSFHHAVAKLLFVCIWDRRDIQTALAFLTTQVKAPDKDDWAKL